MHEQTRSRQQDRGVGYLVKVRAAFPQVVVLLLFANHRGGRLPVVVHLEVCDEVESSFHRAEEQKEQKQFREERPKKKAGASIRPLVSSLEKATIDSLLRVNGVFHYIIATSGRLMVRRRESEDRFQAGGGCLSRISCRLPYRCSEHKLASAVRAQGFQIQLTESCSSIRTPRQLSRLFFRNEPGRRVIS